MSRSGYDDDYGSDNPWDLTRYRGAVASAFRGKRGRAFLREMLFALDRLPEKKLIANDLVRSGEVCAIGAVGLVRGVDMDFDPEDAEAVAAKFGIAVAMAREIVWMNDEAGFYKETPEQRFQRIRQWIVRQVPQPGFPVPLNGPEMRQ